MNRRCLCIVVAALYLLPAAPLAGEAQQAGNLRDRVGYLSLGRAARRRCSSNAFVSWVTWTART